MVGSYYNLCYYNANNKEWWDNLMMSVNIELAKKLFQKHTFEETEVVQIISQKFLTEFEELRKTIQAKIGGKHINRDIYMYFYQFKFFLKVKQFDKEMIGSF